MMDIEGGGVLKGVPKQEPVCVRTDALKMSPVLEEF